SGAAAGSDQDAVTATSSGSRSGDGRCPNAQDAPNEARRERRRELRAVPEVEIRARCSVCGRTPYERSGEAEGRIDGTHRIAARHAGRHAVEAPELLDARQSPAPCIVDRQAL